MSTFFKVNYQAQEFDIEIDDDLNMNFLDYDIQYDQAAREFGYGITPAISLLRTWKDTPSELFSRDFGLSQKQVILLAVDWAEHVSPIYHKHFPHDRRVRAAIIAARNQVVDPSLNKQSAEAAWYETLKAMNDAGDAVFREGARYAVAAARDAVHASFDNTMGIWVAMVGSTSWYALHAAAHEASTGKLAIDYPGQVAYEAENAWQIRHGLKVIEYARGERGSWPSVGVLP